VRGALPARRVAGFGMTNFELKFHRVSPFGRLGGHIWLSAKVRGRLRVAEDWSAASSSDAAGVAG